MVLRQLKEIYVRQPDWEALGAMVEERLHQAVQSIAERNSELALQVRESDWEVDQMEVEVAGCAHDHGGSAVELVVFGGHAVADR